MDTTLHILVMMATLMLTGLGLTSMFAPKKMLANFALEPIGIAGLNTIRSVMGGLFLACVAVLVKGLISGTSDGYFFVATLMFAVAFGRVVGLILDGFDRSVVPPLVLELVIATILLLAHMNNGGLS